MLFGQAGVPIRLSKTIPLYKTNRYVQAEIYDPANTGVNQTLLDTVNLLHEASGRYSGWYTPPENYKYLNVDFKVYTDSGYTTLDNAYLPIPEQLVLDSFGSGAFGGGGGSIFRLTEKDKKEIAEMVIKEIKPLVNIKTPKIDMASTNDLIRDNSLKIIQFSNDIQNSIKIKIERALKAIEMKKEDKTIQESIVKLVTEVQKIQKDNHKQMQEQVNTVDQKVNHLDHIKVGERVAGLLEKSNRKTDESNNKAFQILFLELNKKFEDMKKIQKVNTQDLKTIKLLTTLLDKFVNSPKVKK